MSEEPRLRDEVARLIDEHRGGRAVDVSVEVRTPDGPVLEREPLRPHYAASTMKLPVLVAAYRQRDRGQLDLDAEVRVHNDFASLGSGRFALDPADDSDPQVWDRLGGTAPLGWLCRRMIVRSSNLATDLVLEQVGFDPVAEAIVACRADGVQVGRMIGDFGAQGDGHSNRVTAAGLAATLWSLERGTAAAPDTCAELLDVLAANGVDTDVRPGLPPGTWVAHKNGWVSDAVHDAALVRPDDAPPFTLVVLTSGAWADLPAGADPDAPEHQPAIEAGNDRGHALIRTLASAVWRHRHQL